MDLENLREKVLHAIQGISVATIEGSKPQFEARLVETKGDPIIGLIEKSTGDAFVVQVQRIKNRSPR